MDNCKEESTVEGQKNAEIQRRETLLINKINGLWYKKCGIESERLARPLVSIIRHVYGAKHSYSTRVREVFAKIVKR